MRVSQPTLTEIPFYSENEYLKQQHINDVNTIENLKSVLKIKDETIQKLKGNTVSILVEQTLRQNLSLQEKSI